MDFEQLLIKRRSVRKFKSDKISEDKLKEVVDSAGYAASAMNQQSWEFIVITNENIIKKLSLLLDGEDDKPFYGAPCLIISLAKKDNIAPVVDTSLAMSNMMFKATEIGLATCWIHRIKLIVNDDKYRDIKESFGISDEYISIGALAIGYSDEKRKEMREMKKDYCRFIR